jgi:hypothetical protein
MRTKLALRLLSFAHSGWTDIQIKQFLLEHNFPHLGLRTMRVNACQVFYEGGADSTILLGIEDVTDRR